MSDRQGKRMIRPVSEKNNVDEQYPLWGRSKAGSAGQHVYITNKQNKAVGSESRMLWNHTRVSFALERVTKGGSAC